MKTLKISFAFILIMLSFRSLSQQVVEPPPKPEKIQYKTENPDSLRLPVSRAEILFLCQSLLQKEQRQIESFARIFWRALSNPLNFDERHQTICYSSVDDPKPVLALWSVVNDEARFANRLFANKFFCSCLEVSSLDSFDAFINDRLRSINLLRTFDTSVLHPNVPFRGKIRERLSQIQLGLQKEGLTFMVFDKGGYYKSALGIMVVKNEGVEQLEKILKRMDLKPLSRKSVFRK